MPNGRTLAQNMEDARLLLKVQGYLRDSESDRIKREIERDWNQPAAQEPAAAAKEEQS